MKASPNRGMKPIHNSLGIDPDEMVDLEHSCHSSNCSLCTPCKMQRCGFPLRACRMCALCIAAEVCM